MYTHHKLAIETITNKLKLREDILGIIVGGSVAHGFAGEKSDVDLMLVLSSEDYAKAIKSNAMVYFETEATPYEEGYIDAKYTSIDFIKKVASQGTEPAKFAYKDAFVTYSKIEELDQLVAAASRYPIERKDKNLESFYAQFEAWKWFFNEGLKRNDKYLMDCAISNYVLFAGRLILTHNETLYPYHKWFMTVLEKAKDKPEDFMVNIRNVMDHRTPEAVEALFNCMINFRKWTTKEEIWCMQFMLDSELNWLNGPSPIADL